jgi:hypothetical protein
MMLQIKRNLPIVSAITTVDLTDGLCILVLVHEDICPSQPFPVVNKAAKGIWSNNVINL